MPALVKAWGGIWLLASIGMFLSFKYVLALDDELREEAKNSVIHNLWRVNHFLNPKVTIKVGSDYITTIEELRELSVLIGECNVKSRNLMASKIYADWAKIVAALHIVSLLTWGGLVLKTGINEEISGLAFFFAPLGLFLIFWILALIKKMSVHGRTDAGNF